MIFFRMELFTIKFIFCSITLCNTWCILISPEVVCLVPKLVACILSLRLNETGGSVINICLYGSMNSFESQKCRLFHKTADILLNK